jgi:hypothetical protein
MNALAHSPRVFPHEVFHQHLDILAPLAQRWQLNREHIQAIEKIFSEFLVSNVLVQIAIGRGDNPDVDVQSSHSAEPFKLSVLQDSQ